MILIINFKVSTFMCDNSDVLGFLLRLISRLTFTSIGIKSVISAFLGGVPSGMRWSRSEL